MSEENTTIPTPADIAPPAQVDPPAETPAQEAAAPTWESLFEGEDPAKVREALEQSRKWESRAKANKEAADRLAEIEEANKSEAEKAAERLAAAEKAAADLEAKVLRRDLAIEHRLTAEDAALLDGITDEEALRSLAARLEPVAGPRTPAPNPAQGSSPSGSQGVAQVTKAELEGMTPEQIVKAKSEGRLADLLNAKS